ncbi:hypothetical protein [Argonema galeatum]|uniref:hypothetical protein n=1 Tax=Argonema galeatum TaxID=2942762 RepID=UPI002012E565|nr:hypothetical protein [Argonema galeatum]MCL1466109.1 hypothetical protein [Argonema galeatum A003/A1]
MVNKLVVPKMSEVRVEGIKAIIEQLGIAKAAFFLRENMSQNVDYLEVKEEMFVNKTAREIYAEIKRNG